MLPQSILFLLIPLCRSRKKSLKLFWIERWSIKVLIKCKGLLIEHANWEFYYDLLKKFLSFHLFLGQGCTWGGGGIVTSFRKLNLCKGMNNINIPSIFFPRISLSTFPFVIPYSSGIIHTLNPLFLGRRILGEPIFLKCPLRLPSCGTPFSPLRQGSQLGLCALSV